MMLEFLYKGSYTIPRGRLPNSKSTSSAQQPPMKGQKTLAEIANEPLPHPGYIHLRMYGLADYLMIDSLKEVTKRSFLKTLDGWEN